MHTDTLKKKPTGSANYPAGHTDTRTVTPDAEKILHTLRAAFALKGHALHRTHPAVGPVEYWAERWGLVRYLPTIDTARRFLESIGGRL
jgi:hypothetical protein